MVVDDVLYLLHPGSQVLDKELPQVVQSLQLLSLREQNNFRPKLGSLHSCFGFISRAGLSTARQPYTALGLGVQINHKTSIMV